MFSKCFKVSGNCTCCEYYHTSFVLDCLVAKLLMGIPKQMSTLRFQGIIEVGWDFWYQVQPLLLEQGHPEQVAQDVSPQVLSRLQGWRCHNFCGQPVAVLDHSCSQKVFLVFRFNFVFLQLVPFASCPARGAAEESPASSSSFPPIRRTLLRSHRAFCRLNSHSSQSLSAYEKCCSPFAVFVVLSWAHSVETQSRPMEPSLGRAHSLVSAALRRGEASLLLLTKPNAPQDVVAFLQHEGAVLAHVG